MMNHLHTGFVRLKDFMLRLKSRLLGSVLGIQLLQRMPLKGTSVAAAPKSGPLPVPASAIAGLPGTELEAPVPSSDYRRVALIGYAVIIGAFGVCGGWAAMASIDSAVIASGVVSVESKRQVVQHLEGGIVSEILVKDGQEVKQGQVLFRLDSTTSRANFESVRAQLDTLVAMEARLEAERGQASAITFPPELLSRAGEPTVKAALADQQAQFRDRKASMDGQIDILNSRIRQGQRELEGLARERDSADQQLYFIDDELAGIRALNDKGLVSKPRLAQLQREKARLEGTVGRNMADAAKAETNIGEMSLQIQQLRQKQQEEVAAQIADTRQKIADLREKLSVAQNVLKRIDIRAPRDGVVQNINQKIYTVGAVVRPGDTMLEIVPQNDELIVDAQVPTTDIDRLHNGVTGVEVRFPAFHSRTTPLILGELRTVSPDRLVNESTHEPYYQAVVAVNSTDLPDDMKARLRPGMPAEVVFTTGERTVMSYLTRPLTDALLKSFRER
ncbi:HlyD family type I secretion periplasmic adaptor subunit [Aquabacter sp. P-9]|uniref:HlyD family type I secretion periplasmic adaptor subunit n=1 Tax=Aquabacter sediminis TaxID=3029197 RepID=UPI00237D711F|nr:HlyD family type I secretion periplasmic adaptor subunit [Aquabacter sp. P-9]MDE1569607.1 HlyD family type I secretion periplasmic adaptor subunit [Aquabacter sp. P-9]